MADKIEVKQSLNICPKCRSNNFEGDSVDFDGNFCYQECRCLNCEAEFVREYVLNKSNVTNTEIMYPNTEWLQESVDGVTALPYLEWVKHKVESDTLTGAHQELRAFCSDLFNALANSVKNNLSSEYHFQLRVRFRKIMQQ